MRRPNSIPLLTLVTVILLLSFASLAAVAQPAVNPCPEGQVPDSNGVCIPADQVPTVPPVEADVPTEPGGDDGTATIRGLLLEHYACDAAFDPHVRAGDRDAACTGAAKPAFTYTISIRGQIIRTVAMQTGEGTRGTLELESTPDQPLLTGEMVIAVDPVAGWAPGYLFCDIFSPDAGDRVVEPDVSDGSAELTTEREEFLHCEWYHVEVGPGVVTDPGEAIGADITIAAYLCPAGTTATDDLVAACSERASGMPFSLVTATDTVTTQTSDAEGDIFFADVAPNDYGIEATLPAGYGQPIVICYHAFANGIVEEGAEDIVLGNQFRFTVFGDGESLECAWYNVPALGADNGPNIFVEARTCSPGTSISSSMSVFDAQGLCQTFYIDLDFQVLNVSQVIATGKTSDDFLSPGQVFFTKLPEPESGGYGVTAGVREGERTLAVFCDQDFGDGAFQIVPVRVSGDRMDQELGMGAGNTMRCTWFIEMSPLLTGTHVPQTPAQEAAPSEATEEPVSDDAGEQQAVDPDAGDVDEEKSGDPALGEPGLAFTARLCPPEVAGQDVDLESICTEPATGFAFEIAVDGESTGTYVTDDTGEIVIPVELGPGQYLFRYQPGPDQLELRTACTSVYADGSTATGWSSMVGSDMGEVYLTYDGMSSTVCTFYFVLDSAAQEAADPADSPVDAPEESTNPGSGDNQGNASTSAPSLTLQFWSCPEGTDPATAPEELEQTCAIESADQSFMLTRDGVTTAETVPGIGAWELDDPVVVIEIGPGQASTVSCTSTWDDGGDHVPASTFLDDGALTLEVTDPAITVSCNWFLLPD